MPADSHSDSQARMKSREVKNSHAGSGARSKSTATKRLGPVARPSDGKAVGKYRAPLGQ